MRHFLKEKNQKFQVFFQKKVFCAFWALDIAPTLDVPVLFFFFRQTTDVTLYVPLFSTDVNRFTGTQRSRVRVPASVRNFFEHLRKRTRLKGPLFQLFSALCDFFRFFPFKFFRLFCNKLDFQQAQWVPPFTFFHYETIRNFDRSKALSQILTGVKCYIRIFDVISELCCVSLTRRRRFEQDGNVQSRRYI